MAAMVRKGRAGDVEDTVGEYRGRGYVFLLQVSCLKRFTADQSSHAAEQESSKSPPSLHFLLPGYKQFCH